jgi:hypothetical protein
LTRGTACGRGIDREESHVAARSWSCRSQHSRPRGSYLLRRRPVPFLAPVSRSSSNATAGEGRETKRRPSREMTGKKRPVDEGLRRPSRNCQPTPKGSLWVGRRSRRGWTLRRTSASQLPPVSAALDSGRHSPRLPHQQHSPRPCPEGRAIYAETLTAMNDSAAAGGRCSSGTNRSGPQRDPPRNSTLAD